MTAPAKPWPFPPFHGQWYLADTEVGWFVVSPWGGHCGPFTEDAGALMMRALRAYPVWCPTCLLPMTQEQLEGVQYWLCRECHLTVMQDEIARIIKANE